MTPIEAHELTMENIEELKNEGIQAIITPSERGNDEKLVEKYNRPERVPPEYWNNVHFKVECKQQADRIAEVLNYLGMCGIGFDTGGHKNTRDWRLDWSFRYTGKDNEEWREAASEVEDMIQDLDKKESWEGGKVVCNLCGHSWVAVRLPDAPKLECPNCGNMTDYEYE